MADLLTADIARGDRCDALVPVPLHPERARARGAREQAAAGELRAEWDLVKEQWP